jgi:hypothetical protein
MTSTSLHSEAARTPWHLIQDEAALTYPGFDLIGFVRRGTEALEIAGDPTVERARRRVALNMGCTVSLFILRLREAARARHGHGFGGAAHDKMRS